MRTTHEKRTTQSVSTGLRINKEISGGLTRPACDRRGGLLSDSLFEEIRKRCEQIARIARHVQVNVGRIESYAHELQSRPYSSLHLDPLYHYIGETSATVAYILALDTVNFGSGYFPHLRKKKSGASGYFTIAANLKDYFIHNGPLTAKQLSALDASDCALIFGQEEENDEVLRELMSLFALALNQLGQCVSTHFDGDFTTLVDESRHSAESMVRLLIEMPSFQDVAFYHGIRVPFYKRAQITVSDLSLAFNGQGLGDFYDLDLLTVFADNAVPHVLKVDGVLQYDTSLSKMVERGELIPPGCEEEVEIRAATIYATELVVNAMNKNAINANKLNSMNLDYLLWNKAQESVYRNKPCHMTRTWFY